MVYSNGVCVEYEGAWRNDQPEGFGITRYADGRVHRGEHRKGVALTGDEASVARQAAAAAAGRVSDGTKDTKRRNDTSASSDISNNSNSNAKKQKKA